FRLQPARHSPDTHAATPLQSLSVAHCAHLPAKQRSTPDPPQSRSLLHMTLATQIESSQTWRQVQMLANRLQSDRTPSLQLSSSSAHSTESEGLKSSQQSSSATHSTRWHSFAVCGICSTRSRHTEPTQPMPSWQS